MTNKSKIRFCQNSLWKKFCVEKFKIKSYNILVFKKFVILMSSAVQHIKLFTI